MCAQFLVHGNAMRWLVCFVHVLDAWYMWNKCLIHEKTLFLYFGLVGTVGHWLPLARPRVSSFGVVGC